jgi:arylformamidase
MPALDMEAEYNNRARVSNSAEIIERWAKAAVLARSELPGARDVAYGTKPRQVYDYYPAGGGSDTPLAVYIHGGYWQRGHGHDYAFVARELLARGVSVAIPSYTLCPEVGIAGITDEIAVFLGALWARTKVRPLLVGHSAGGHLAATLMSRGRIDGAPDDLITAAYGISGVYDLRPLVGTSLNEALRMDDATAKSVSPMFASAPNGRRFVAAAGGDESSEFIRQAHEFAAVWSKGGAAATSMIIPGANHFTIVDELTKPSSAMLNEIVAMAEHVAS